jgi:hypothetical protein
MESYKRTDVWIKKVIDIRLAEITISDSPL